MSDDAAKWACPSGSMVSGRLAGERATDDQITQWSEVCSIPDRARAFGAVLDALKAERSVLITERVQAPTLRRKHFSRARRINIMDLDQGTPFGACIRIEPGDEDWTDDADVMRARLSGIESRVASVVSRFRDYGARTLLDAPSVYVWIDRAGASLEDGLAVAGQCSIALRDAGFQIESVRVVDWRWQAILA